MKKLTLAQKLDIYNDLTENPVLDGSCEKMDKFKNHKEADEMIDLITEDIEKDGGAVEVKEETQIVETDTILVDVSDACTAKDLIHAVVFAANVSDNEWEKTGSFLTGHASLFGEDAKQNRKIFYKELDKGATEDNVPELGINNDGQEIQLRKKGGAVKWSAWSKTRLFTKNMSDVFKAVQVSGWDLVFPDGKIVTRPEVLELGKDGDSQGEAPIDTFKRSIMLCEKKLEELDPADKDLVFELIASVNGQFQEWVKTLK